jgi:DNA-binding transcriptional ArsR family regulator
MVAVTTLREAGVAVEQVDRGQRVEVDAILDLTLGDMSTRFAVEEKQRAPYPNEMSRLVVIKRRLTGAGEPMLILPFVSETLARSLTSEGWSWADGGGNFDLRAKGLVLRQRSTTSTPRATAKLLPQGTGSLGIVRALIRFTAAANEEPRATSLAAQANVSQPRASQVLRQLLDLGLVAKTAQGRWVPDREALLDRFIAEYRGPGGSEQYFYSLDPPNDVARRAAQWQSDRKQLAVSADVGPDLVLAWRRPSVAILYTRHLLEVADLRLVVAQGRHDANVIVRIPDDTSVFPVPPLVADMNGVDIPLADVTQQIWDLHDLGGADRLEAAGMLREWLLNRP